MACYESTFVIRQDVLVQDVNDIASQIAGSIEKFGGTIVKKEYWGLRSLAYVIKKNRRGHYVMFGVRIDGDVSDFVKNLERVYSVNEDIIRYLTVRVDDVDSNPSIMMRSQQEVSV